MTPHWNLEEITLRGEAIFARGWFWQPGARVQEMQLVLRDQMGRERSRIRLLDSQPRYDVASHFPSEDNESLNTGFVGLGSWGCQPSASDQVQLEISFLNTEKQCLDISAAANLGEAKSGRWRQKIRQRWGLIKKAISLLARGDWQSFAYKLTLHVEQNSAKALPEEKSWRQLVNGLPQGRPIHLIVDHQLGGGANDYRERQVQSWLAEGAIAITLSFQISKLAYELRLQWDDNCQRFISSYEHAILEAISHLSPISIVFNNAVSFAAPTHITPMLLLLKQRSGARLVVLIHDYFLLCPTIYLLDSKEQFCGVPQVRHCEKCLPKCQYLFSSFYRGSVSSWRSHWGGLLAKADSIVAFSEASAQLLRQAYNQWPSWVPIEIKPHTLPRSPGEPIQPRRSEHAIIGIVGQIGVQKGSKIVQKLAEEIQRQGGRERITVIGSLECRADPRIVSQTGHYHPRDLRRLILESGANIMLMPSIWPETFSYVTEELIQLDLPIACFDLGAPAERVIHYPKGLLLSTMQPASILRDLRRFLQTLQGLTPVDHHES